jgi:hypothetical protein
VTTASLIERPLEWPETHCETKAILPWERDGRRVVSLLDMQQFYADFFLKATAQLNAFERLAKNENRATLGKPQLTTALYAELGGLMTDSALHGFDSIGLQCQRTMKRMQDKNMVLTCGEIGNELENLRTRVEDEFSRHLFLHLTLREADIFQNPEKHWENVASRFPKMRYNIEESAKCFALNRYGAAVFHVLQIAEYGVIQVGDLLGVLGDKPGWSCLKRLQDLIAVPYPQRIPLARQHTKLLEDVVPLAVVVKDSWRHKLDHVDNQIRWVDTDFSPQVAEEIISATRGFMRKLASELPK